MEKECSFHLVLIGSGLGAGGLRRPQYEQDKDNA
jgi:hypothetical protein